MSPSASRFLAVLFGLAVGGALVAIYFFGFGGSAGVPRAVVDLKKQAEYAAAATGTTYKPDGPLPFALKPNLSQPPTLVTSSLGLRSPELAARKTTPRVMVLGDSMTYGFGLKEGEPFCSIAAEKLRGKAEVANCALSGYQIQDLAAQFERLVDAVDPDVVIVTFMINDLDDSHSRTPDGQAGWPTLAELPADCTFATGSNVVRMAHLGGLRGDAAQKFVRTSWISDELMFRGIGPFARARLARYRADLERIVSGARKRGAEVAMLSFYPLQAAILETCEALRVPIFDTGPRIDLASKRFQLDGDPHPNAWANTLLADRLLEILAATKRIPLPGVAPAAPLEVRPALVRSMREDSLRHACDKLRPNVVLHPTEAHANLHQALAGFEDANGKLGGRAVVLLQSQSRPTRLRMTAAAALPDGEAPRKLELRITGAAPRTVEVPRRVESYSFDLADAEIEKLGEPAKGHLVEVDLRDPTVTAAPPAGRAARAVVRIHRLGLEGAP